MQTNCGPISNPVNLYRVFLLKLARFKAEYYDRKLGIKTQGRIAKTGLDSGFYDDAIGYSPSFYGILQRVAKYLKFTPQDVFMDLGCGKGRAVFFMATYKLKKVVGVELDKNLFAQAQENLKNLKLSVSPVELFNADAANFDLSSANIIYMFRPFGLKTCQQIIGNLKRSLEENPRSLRIVYYVPQWKELLNQQDWLKPEARIGDDNCLVWRSKLA